MKSNLEISQTFTEDTLPDLDVITLAALELFADQALPKIDFGMYKRPLVVGSGNAAVTGKLLFDDTDAIFADESSYIHKLAHITSIDGACLISASGGKHAIEIAKKLKERSISTILLTNNSNAQAAQYLDKDSVHVFPKNREPYTYNTSTYMGMLLAKTHEDPAVLHEFITHEVLTRIPSNLASHKAFFFIVPAAFDDVREMFETKFNELFGPKLMARVFTYEQTKHAKTVIPEETELFVSFGVDNELFGTPAQRLYIPLPPACSYAAMMAIGYSFIGHIQKQFPPYYKDRVVVYTKETSEAFGSAIRPIVE